MTPGEALDVLAEEVTCVALQELIDNGLGDTYIDAELTDKSSEQLRDRLSARVAARPDAATLERALRAHVRLQV